MRFIAMSVLATVCAFGVYAQDEAAGNDQSNNESEVVQSEPVESEDAE